MNPLRKWLAASRFYMYNAWVSKMPGYGFRRWYLRNVLRYKVDSTASIHMGCFFTGWKFEIGPHSVVNRNCYLDCRAGITIGANVSISPECYIITASHDPQSALFEGKNAPVHLEDRVWLGARVMVLPGRRMQTGSVAGAGSVVTRDVAPFNIVAGNPATVVGSRSPELTYNLSWFPYFDTDIQ